MTNEALPSTPLLAAAVHYFGPAEWRTACLIDTQFPGVSLNLRRTQNSSKVTCPGCREAMLEQSPAPAPEYVIPANVHEHDSVPLAPADFFPTLALFAQLQRERTEVVALEEASLAVLRDAALELSRAVATRERLDASIKEILATS
jgi:hypothetical protein